MSAYRPSRTDLSTRQLAYAPVTIVLRSNNVPLPKTMFPFDSGAFETELYKRHFHPEMRLKDFSLNGPLALAGRVITRFYGSNQDYYAGMTSVPAPPALEFE